MRADPETAETARRARFEAMFTEHFRPLLGYALRRASDPAAAADVVAETFLVAWRRLDDVPPEPELRLWLYGTARRVLANHHRSERRRSDLAAKLATSLTESLPDGSELSLDVRSALLRLDPDDAELLRLTAWEGLSPTELALMWGIPAATVRTRLHRARRRLRAEMDGERSPLSGHVMGDGHPWAGAPTLPIGAAVLLAYLPATFRREIRMNGGDARPPCTPAPARD